MVFINGTLAVATSITIPDVSKITADQAAKLAAALGPSIVNATQAAVNNSPASNPATAGTPVTTIVTGAGTGQVVTNGVLNVVQNGPGNSAAVGTLAGAPATVIQNTLDNQSFRILTTIDAGVNTLQAFRSQLANATLNSALLRAASMR
ncbi:hypothetical protein [Cupriavidus sp. BIC8F]|nr:hypothetical protein [Cupriavidus sp. BIC8F]